MSNLTALIARDEYVLEESYSGEEEPDEDAEEVKHLTSPLFAIKHYIFESRFMKMIMWIKIDGDLSER